MNNLYSIELCAGAGGQAIGLHKSGFKHICLIDNDADACETLKLNNKKVYNFLLNKWYFDEIYNHFLVQPLKKIGSFLWKTGDENTIDKYGPNGISKIVKIISSKAVKLQSGYIFDYAFIMLLGFSLLLTFFIIYK